MIERKMISYESLLARYKEHCYGVFTPELIGLSIKDWLDLAGKMIMTAQSKWTAKNLMDTILDSKAFQFDGILVVPCSDLGRGRVRFWGSWPTPRANPYSPTFEAFPFEPIALTSRFQCKEIFINADNENQRMGSEASRTSAG